MTEKEMKKCQDCKQVLSLEDFPWRSKADGIRDSYCRVCSRKRIKAAQEKARKDPEKRSKMLENNKRCVNKNRVLHLDHIDPATKGKNVTMAIGKLSLGQILEELPKCRVLCSKCHMKVTHKDAYDGDTGEFDDYMETCNEKMSTL